MKLLTSGISRVAHIRSICNLSKTRGFPLLTSNNDKVNIESRRGILFKMGNQPPTNIVGYYVVFPVIPDETVENNTFLANIAQNGDWPTLNSATPKEMYEGTVRSLMEYGATVMEHLEHLEQNKPGQYSFDNVVDPLLSEEYDVDYAFNTLLVKMLTDWTECSNKSFDADFHHIKVMSARDRMEKLGNPAFQQALKDLYQSESLDPWKKRLIEWYLLEIRASGMDKTDEKERKVIGSWSRFIDEYRSKYLTNILSTNDQHVFSVSDRGSLKDAPPHILKTLAVDKNNYNDGPWRGLMTPSSILPFLQYCNNRQLRATAWERWISKASFEHDFYNNSINIEEIRHNNDGLAKALGFPSVAEHRLANKMAGSVDNVRKLLNPFTRRIRPVFIDRMEAWSSYAGAKELITSELQPFDLYYICRREAEHHFDVDSLDFMNHFPFWPTFENLTQILSHLFGLKFQDVTESNLERCHPSVRIYSVADTHTNEHLGRLYIDPFERANKRCSWTTLLGRTSNSIRNLDKIVYLIGGANEPDSNGKSFLHYTQLQQLLFHTGRAVQLLCSRSPYRDIAIPQSPMYASDWDAVDIFPVFTQFFVNKPNLLAALSSPHAQTSATLTEEAANCASLAISRASLWETYRVLFWSDFDLSIYEMEDRKKKFWLDLYRELYKEYFPFKLERTNYQPCSFTPVFGIQPFMSMYYRKLWAEMLALDVHETFNDEGNEQVTGERFKTVILNQGAGDLQSELYRRFQGRDPSVGAICDFYDPPAVYAPEEEQSSAI
uniref:Peptidase M3A/M3B catalytic domain-containing protein n=1 Tax=Panagrolaimus sp. PS1159 TaxID=55785 RepID=A0AC35FA18_9BILA